MPNNFLEKNLIQKIKSKYPLLVKLYHHELSNKDKIIITEKLGAAKFQKLVFKVERWKYKILKKFFPNYLKYHDKFIDWQKNRKIKKIHSEYEKERIIKNANLQKELAHKEYNQEINRNYHLNMKRPLEIIEYLKWNKDIHKKGLKNDFVITIILCLISLVGITQAMVFIPFELLSMFINFECVNIQNHNLYRLAEKKEKLEQIQIRNTKRNVKKFEQANKLIADRHHELKNVPTIDNIIESIKTKEQLEQLKKLIEEQISSNNTINKQKGMRI